MWAQDSQISAAAGLLLRHGFSGEAALALIAIVATFAGAWFGWRALKCLNLRPNISKNCETTR